MISEQPLIYANFSSAQKQLNDIEAIDYFLAKQLSTAIFANESIKTNCSPAEQTILFHLVMVVNLSLRQGHSCLPLSEIANTIWGRASDNENIVTQQGFYFPALTHLQTLLVKLELADEQQQPLVYWQNCLYLRRYFSFEQELAVAIKAKLNADKSLNLALIKNCLVQLFSPEDFISQSKNKLDWQMISVANALNKKFTIVAGGPGTGKTYTVTKILAAIILLAQSLHTTNTSSALKIALVAPTGKAAQRLSESINKAVGQFQGKIDQQVLANIPTQAQTIHRLLGVIPQSNQFRHHQNNKLVLDVLLIDEASMVDLALMTRVFRALDQNCQVILLGDADQLPSVQTGSVLSELAPRPQLGYSSANIDYLQSVTEQNNLDAFVSKNNIYSDALTVLTKSHRFDGEGGIGQLAKAVIAGKSELSWQLLSANGDKNITKQLHLIAINYTSTQANAQQNLFDVMSNQHRQWLSPLVKKYYLPLFSCDSIAEAYKLFSNFRVLCATRQGGAGVDYFNDLIASILNSYGINNIGEDYYHGQPIMITENNYQSGLYNGDIGIVWRDQHGHLVVAFENTALEKTANEEINNEKTGNKNHAENIDSYRYFFLSQLPQHQAVYAMTIHKTQGSEFDHVAMVLPEQAEHQLLSRELLYTGITRAKSQLTIVSKANVWQQAVTKKVRRFANLAQRVFS
ncbi:MAG: exodeoxyribonuclease V subunit alpha [Gammaproteobacteria bacterium]|nr:MAG: exodeoxyribonuclease V subunit alpha [Gammaproteobacteria bacterium]